MNNKLLFIFSLVFITGCVGKTKNTFDVEYLKKIMPTVEGNQTFDFSYLSDDIWNWQKSPKLIKIDSAFWLDYINKPNSLGDYQYNYQTNYFYKLLDFNDNFINIVILQYINNGNESKMYLLKFDNEGNRIKEIILASIYKSPDEFEELHSSINGNKITTYKYYVDETTNKRDTIISIW